MPVSPSILRPRLHRLGLWSLFLSPLGCSGATSTTDGGPTPQTPSPAKVVPAEDYAGLVINEVAPAGDPSDWFELVNTSSKTLSLDELAFTDDIVGAPLKARFPLGVTLAPGEYFALDVNDELQGFKLGGDEELGLYTISGELIDEVDWAEGDAPLGQSYGRMPDGTGPFLTLTQPTRGAENVAPLEVEDDAGPATEDDVLDDDSALDGGVTEDAGESGSGSEPRPEVVINEVSSTDDDAIELHNLGSVAVDLTGWRIADSAYDPAVATTIDAQSYLLPVGTVLSAGGYLVLRKGIDHTFGLGSDDAVSLFDDGGGLIDSADWAAQQAEVSFCRRPNGTGPFAACTAASFGASNP